MLDNAFRHPALVAKMASSLDVISNGRLELGLGTGSYPREHPEYGIYFPGARERTERLEESIDIIKLLFTQERTTFKGKFFELEDAPLLPKSVQQPHPPIWIGGAGPSSPYRSPRARPTSGMPPPARPPLWRRRSNS